MRQASVSATLHALTDGGDPKRAGHFADGLDQAAVYQIAAEAADQLPVDLEEIHRNLL